MVAGIRLGDLFVQDLNLNNLFDPEIDSVIDVQGKTLTGPEKSLKLQSVLKEMGLRSWGGVFLNHAADFFRWIRNALENAEEGKVDETGEAGQGPGLCGGI